MLASFYYTEKGELMRKKTISQGYDLIFTYNEHSFFDTKEDNRRSWIGKERDKESLLGDFGARKYDFLSGRFTSIDPLWEKYYSLTPYQYSFNNPVAYIDPSGMFVGLMALGAGQVAPGCFGGTGNDKRPTDFGVSYLDEPQSIVVYPGHGDHHNTNSKVDPGGVSGSIYEKYLTLEISNSLTETLESEGFCVTQTRNSDVEDAGTKLKWRIEKGELHSVFISVHINSSSNKKANGMEVYYKTGDESGKNLANSILDQNSLFNNRGVKSTSKLYVLNNFQGVAILIEAGFISNSHLSKIIKKT